MIEIDTINFGGKSVGYFTSVTEELKCFDTVFGIPYRYFSITYKLILSLSDCYNIFTSDWLWIEVCQNADFSKIDITMTTTNKKLWNRYNPNFARSSLRTGEKSALQHSLFWRHANFSKLMPTIHKSMTGTFQCEYCLTGCLPVQSGQGISRETVGRKSQMYQLPLAWQM